nr:nuclear transport factor 2 family protein [Sphingomonas vulcanisoli]
MVCISTIDIQTRLDVQELLSHFSHFLDHDRGACWADLFTTDGVFECADGNRLCGAAELATLPSMVNERGHGAWRHLITAPIIQRCNTRKEMSVHAYCQVLDMDENSAVAAFYDLDLTLRHAARWRISHALARRVGVSVSANIGAAAMANTASAQRSLQ